MPGGKGNSLCNSLLNHTLGGPDYVRPTSVWVGLFTTTPTSAGGGVEVAGGGYARVQLTNNSTNFPSATNRIKTNGVVIDFGQAQASWGQVVAAAVFATQNATEPMFWGPLSFPKTVDAGDEIRINAGGAQFTES